MWGGFDLKKICQKIHKEKVTWEDYEDLVSIVGDEIDTAIAVHSHDDDLLELLLEYNKNFRSEIHKRLSTRKTTSKDEKSPKKRKSKSIPDLQPEPVHSLPSDPTPPPSKKKISKKEQKISQAPLIEDLPPIQPEPEPESLIIEGGRTRASAKKRKNYCEIDKKSRSKLKKRAVSAPK